MTTQDSSRQESDAERLHEELKPQTAPTPEPSRDLGAKEEEVNRDQVSNLPDTDAPGG
jgi:hypothetical protein